MQQYFVEKDIEINDMIQLTQDDAHHLEHVMRCQSKDLIRISNTKRLFLGEVVFDGGILQIKVIEEIFENKELPLKITLVMSLIKGNNFDLVIQKATELGVASIIPLQAQRSVVKVNKKFANKITRYQRISEEAAEQSERLRPAEIKMPIGVDELDQYKSEANYILYERQDCAHLISSIDSNATSITIVIGPEGGFAPEEATAIIDKGFEPASLGNRILRAETAAISAVSLIGSVVEGIEK